MSTQRTVLIMALGLAVNLWLASCGGAPPAPTEGAQPTGPEATFDATVESPPPRPLRLEPRVTEEIELASGQTRSWTLEPPPDHFVHLRAEQKGVDVVLKLLDRSGRVLLVADSPIDDQGVEELMFVGDVTGTPSSLRVEVAGARHPKQGTLRLWVEAFRRASTADRARVRAMQTFHRGEEARRRRDWQSALDIHRRSLAVWRRIGDPQYEAETLDRLGRIYAALGLWQEAETQHVAAAERFGDAGDPRRRAINLHFSGWAQVQLRRAAPAIESFRSALPLRREVGDLRGEALTLGSLARAFQMRDETQSALDAHRDALDLFEELRDVEGRGVSLHNLGVLFGDQGDWRRAQSHLDRAVELWREHGNLRRLADSLNQRGELLLKRRAAAGDLLGESDVAELATVAAALAEALALRRQEGDLRGEASTLANLAQIRWFEGDTLHARQLYEEALDRLRNLGRPLSEVKVLLGLGDVELAEGGFDEAEERYLRAVELCRFVGDASGEARGMSGLARAHRGRGRMVEALEASARSLEIVEKIRPRAQAPGLRASFFATVQGHYDLHIDLLLDLHEEEPEAGFDREALMTTERARARSLLDLVGQRGARPRGRPGSTQHDSEEETALVRDIAELDRLRLNSEGQKARSRPRSPELRDIEIRLAERLERLETLRASRWAGAPDLQPGDSTEIASFQAIHQAIQQRGVDLVVFRLGRHRSVRWEITESDLRVHELPPRQAIERLALEAHQLLSRSHRRETLPALQATLCRLSRVLLDAAQIGTAEAPLVVVPDGALHYLPLAVLPRLPSDGCRDGERILDQRVVVTVPSASVWTRMAAAPRHAGTNRGALAVVADPVFTPGDPRVGAPNGVRGKAVADLSGLRRLHSSRREALSVAALAPGRSDLWLDFDADKQRVLQGGLSGYRYLHFATHGSLDTEFPLLSGIVLSQVDRQGRAVDGVIRSLDLFRLELDSELVVLSACETALGETVRGEGMMGLSRAFLAAGVDRVVVSLWKVSDGGTAALMERLYRGIFTEGLDAAEALRRAQLELSRHPDYGSPYFWAGFVVVGGSRVASPVAPDDPVPVRT